MAHTIIETNKSHNLLSASWGPRKAYGIIWFQSENLRTKGASGVKSESKGPRTRSADVYKQRTDVHQQRTDVLLATRE